MNLNLQAEQPKHEYANTHKFLSENSQENENNQIQLISDDFQKIFDLVKTEINNLKQLEKEMSNFKNKLSKIKTQETQAISLHNQLDTKQNYVNKFESSEKSEKLPSFQQEQEITPNEMIGNLQLGNISMATLENLLKLDLLSKNQNEAKNSGESLTQQTYPENHGSNLNTNDEKLLKKYLKGENKIQKEIPRVNQIHSNNQNDSSELNKREEAQPTLVNNKSEPKKSNNQNLGMSLSEIEKQIAMLKNLSIKQ